MSRSSDQSNSIDDCLNNLVHVFELAFRSLFVVGADDFYFYERLDLLKKTIYEDGFHDPSTITSESLEVYLVRVLSDVVGELLNDFRDKYSFTPTAKQSMGFNVLQSSKLINTSFYLPKEAIENTHDENAITPHDLLLDEFIDFISSYTFKIDLLRNLFSNLMNTSLVQNKSTMALSL